MKEKIGDEEWGMPGSLSFEESFMPFVTVQVEDKTSAELKEPKVWEVDEWTGLGLMNNAQ